MTNKPNDKIRAAVWAMHDENEFLKRAYSQKGFIELYFETLKLTIIPNQETAFETLNDRFNELVGEFRYSSYDSFRVQLRRHLLNRSHK